MLTCSFDIATRRRAERRGRESARNYLMAQCFSLDLWGLVKGEPCEQSSEGHGENGGANEKFHFGYLSVVRLKICLFLARLLGV